MGLRCTQRRHHRTAYPDAYQPPPLWIGPAVFVAPALLIGLLFGTSAAVGAAVLLYVGAMATGWCPDDLALAVARPFVVLLSGAWPLLAAGPGAAAYTVFIYGAALTLAFGRLGSTRGG